MDWYYIEFENGKKALYSSDSIIAAQKSASSIRYAKRVRNDSDFEELKSNGVEVFGSSVA